MKEEFSTLLQYLEYLQSRGRYSFSRNEAIEKLCFTDNAFQLAVHRLIRKGSVKRIRSGFYTIIPLEYQTAGSLPATWFIDSLMKYQNRAAVAQKMHSPSPALGSNKAVRGTHKSKPDPLGRGLNPRER